MAKRVHALLPLWIAVVASGLSTGCSVLIGNIKPSTEKASLYTYQAPSERDPDWFRTQEQNAEAGTDSAEKSDVVFQHRVTHGIISINSTCRPRDEKRESDLKSFTNLLLMGVQNIGERTERPITVDREPALETSLRGALQGQTMQFQTVVLRHQSCLFDLMYLAQPQHFEAKKAAFADLVKSLRFND